MYINNDLIGRGGLMLPVLIAQTTDYDYGTAASDAAAATAAGTAAVGIGIAMIIFWLVFGLATLVLWIWALVDVIRREFPNSNDKVLWIVLIIVLGILGSILYLIIGRKKGTIPAAKVA